MTKEYWFSTRQHAHDITYRYDYVCNEIGRREIEGKHVTQDLYTLKDWLGRIIDCMAGACGQAIKLPKMLWLLAQDTITWAAGMR